MLVTMLSPERPGVVFRRPGHLAGRVDLELLAAGRPPEVGLVLVLEARLPEGVAGLVALRRPRRELGAVDGPDVPEHLRSRVAALRRTGHLQLGVAPLGGRDRADARGTRSGAP